LAPTKGGYPQGQGPREWGCQIRAPETLPTKKGVQKSEPERAHQKGVKLTPLQGGTHGIVKKRHMEWPQRDTIGLMAKKNLARILSRLIGNRERVVIETPLLSLTFQQHFT